MEAIKAGNSAFGTPVATLKLDRPLSDCGAGALCCSVCYKSEISSRRLLVCWCVGAVQCGMVVVSGLPWPWHGTLGYGGR